MSRFGLTKHLIERMGREYKGNCGFDSRRFDLTRFGGRSKDEMKA